MFLNLALSLYDRFCDLSKWINIICKLQLLGIKLKYHFELGTTMSLKTIVQKTQPHLNLFND